MCFSDIVMSFVEKQHVNIIRLEKPFTETFRIKKTPY